jgi:hypothetical protein
MRGSCLGSPWAILDCRSWWAQWAHEGPIIFHVQGGFTFMASMGAWLLKLVALYIHTCVCICKNRNRYIDFPLSTLQPHSPAFLGPVMMVYLKQRIRPQAMSTLRIDVLAKWASIRACRRCIYIPIAHVFRLTYRIWCSSWFTKLPYNHHFVMWLTIARQCQ